MPINYKKVMYMKTSRKLLACGLFLLFVITMTGCAAGEDKLNLFDDDTRIAQEGDSYTFVNRVGLDGSYSANQVNFKYGGFSGIQTIWMLDVNEDTAVTIDVNSRVESGEFKAVLVTPTKRVKTVISGDQQVLKSLSLIPGKYAFKVAGHNANGQVKISIQPGQAVTVEKVE